MSSTTKGTAMNPLTYPRLHTRTNRRPRADRRPRRRPRLPSLRARRRSGLGARRGEGRRPDPRGLQLRHREGSYAADCGTLVVPENRADPKSRLIALPVTRIRARSDDPAEPIFRLEGGPGGTNMEFERASRFADDRDVVLVGYRGVDGSARLDCPEVESALSGRPTTSARSRSARRATRCATARPG